MGLQSEIIAEHNRKALKTKSENFDTPDSPPEYNANEHSAWQSGYESGYRKAMEDAIKLIQD